MTVGTKVGEEDGIFDGNDDGMKFGIKDGAAVGFAVVKTVDRGVFVGLDENEGITIGVKEGASTLIVPDEVTIYNAFADASPQFSPLVHFLFVHLHVGLLQLLH